MTLKRLILHRQGNIVNADDNGSRYSSVVLDIPDDVEILSGSTILTIEDA